MKTITYRPVTGYQTEKPKTVDLTSSSTVVYLRKNIKAVNNKDEEGHVLESKHWEYDEAILSPEEYEEYLGDLQAPSTEMIMQTLSDIQLALDEM